MIEIFIQAFITFVVMIDPVSGGPIYMGLTANHDLQQRRSMAIRGVGVATLILLVFAFGGSWILQRLGIGMPAFRVAGGALLFLLAIEMLFDKRRQRRTNAAEQSREEQSDDISVFPLAIPLLAGPGAIASVMLLMSAAENYSQKGAVVSALVAAMLLSLTVLLTSTALQRFVSQTVASAVSRVLAMIIAALAVQYIFDGVRQSFFAV